MSCSKTTTPDNYLYEVEVSYDSSNLQDIEIITERLMYLYDSIREVSIEEGKKLSKTDDVHIDTIFYGPNNKIAFLAIREIENIFVINSDQQDSFKTTYSGACYLGFKNELTNEIEVLKKLKYLVTSESYEDAKRRLRLKYFREMEYIDGAYNINDKRFWNSLVWNAKQQYPK